MSTDSLQTQAPKVKHIPDEKPEVKLTTCDGNVFALTGRCMKALKRAGLRDAAKELAERVSACGSYDEALQTMMEYVEVS